MSSRRILGIAASLRNARRGALNRNIVSHLYALNTKEELLAYLRNESRTQAQSSQRTDANSDPRGANSNQKNEEPGGNFSNSDVTLAAALWAAQREGAEIDRVSLADFFTQSGQVRQAELLRGKLLEADGMLVSGPVYFGDRGSLSESLIQFILGDRELKAAMRGRLYGGIAVGAKRNGGQETALIYQMLDMLHLGLLSVGNDSETTAQYGGTGHAGDMGTMCQDTYGIDTSMGIGRRMAQVLKLFGARQVLVDRPKTLFLVLQDINEIGMRMVDRLATLFGQSQQATVLNIVDSHLYRCNACDACPARIGPDEEYRCAMNAKDDGMKELHRNLLYHDMIVPVGVSLSGAMVRSNYQVFVERTRYLRHCDYIWSDVMVTPLVLEEQGDFRSLPLRMMTSFLRHHTVMARPIIGCLSDGEVTNKQLVEEHFSRALAYSSKLAAGRLALARESAALRSYNPIGYVTKIDRKADEERQRRLVAAHEARRHRLVTEAERRLEPNSPETAAQRTVYHEYQSAPEMEAG
jgi:multimeric flavodoxin WrbA